MNLQLKVIGYKDFSTTMQSVMRSVTGAERAEALAAGAEVIKIRTQENILENELYEEGDLYDSVKVVKVNQYQVDILVDREYAAVHEFGYTYTITPDQRSFFWAKYYATTDAKEKKMWKCLAVSEQYKIKAKPYLRPAIDETKQAAGLAVGQEMARKLMAALK